MVHVLKNLPKAILLPTKPIITLMSNKKTVRYGEIKTTSSVAKPILKSVLIMTVI